MKFTKENIFNFLTENMQRLESAKNKDDINEFVKSILLEISNNYNSSIVDYETGLRIDSIQSQHSEDIEFDQKYRNEGLPSIPKINTFIKELEQTEKECRGRIHEINQLKKHEMAGKISTIFKDKRLSEDLFSESKYSAEEGELEKRISNNRSIKYKLQDSISLVQEHHPTVELRIRDYGLYIQGLEYKYMEECKKSGKITQYFLPINEYPNHIKQELTQSWYERLLDSDRLKLLETKEQEAKQKLLEIKSYFSEKVILCVCLENFKDNEDISKLLIESLSEEIKIKLIKVAEQISVYDRDIINCKEKLKRIKSDAPNKEEFHKLQESKQYWLEWYKTLNKVIDFIWYFSLSSTSVLLFLFTEVVTLPLFYGFVLSGGVFYCANEISTSLIKKLRKEDLSLNTFNNKFREKCRTYLSEKDEIEQQIKNLQSLISDTEKSESELKAELEDLSKDVSSLRVRP